MDSKLARGIVNGVVLAIPFWTLAIVATCCVLRDGRSKPAEPTEITVGSDALEAAAARRSLLGVLEEAALPATFSSTLDGPVVALDADDRALWSRDRGPCGDGVRPYVWIRGRPKVGGTLRVVLDPYGAPFANAAEGDIYAWQFVFVLVETNAPPLASPLRLPGGCPLWIHPDSRSALVWSLGGKAGYQDPVLRVEDDGRLVVIEHRIENVPWIIGKKVTCQIAAFDPTQVTADGNVGQWKTSQLYELTFGRRR